MPIKKHAREIGLANINRKDPGDFMLAQKTFQVYGKKSKPNEEISDIMRHDYLRKSLVDRVERMNLIKDFRLN